MMSGIAGYFAWEPIGIEEGGDLLSRMLAALAHRGPCDGGRHVESICGLGCIRPASVDSSNGRIPSSEDGTVVCAMSGRIANSSDLRQSLISRGHALADRTESEVLPHLYEEAGSEMAAGLDGMFALAVWDGKERRLLLARDHFGIKPLYMARVRGLVLFASEAKAILATGRVKPRIDPKALRDLGSAGYPMPPRTMFSGIESILPGTWLVLEGRSREKSGRYYTVPYPGGEDAAAGKILTSEGEATDRFRSLFDEAIGKNMSSDVPVGFYVSGGIDSVSVAMRAGALKKEPLNTFSMTFSGKDAGFDESDHSDLAARTMGSRHHRVFQGEIDEADYRGTIRAVEAPQIYTGPFCLYRLAREAGQAGFKVILTGEGADETLAGYDVFKTSKLRRSPPGRHLFIRRAGTWSWLRRRDPDLYAFLLPWWQAENDLTARYGLVPPWSGQWALLAGGWNAALNPELSSRFAVDPSDIETLPECPPGFGNESVNDPLHLDLLFEQRSRMDGWVLSMGEKAAMAHSVEVRMPFLDRRLVELTARVPSSLLLRRYHEKYLLRRAMEGRIPESLRTRRKCAFNPPIERWLFGAEWPPFVEAALSPESLSRTGIFGFRGIARLRARLSEDRPGAGRLSASWALNLALGLQLFMEEFGARL